MPKWVPASKIRNLFAGDVKAATMPKEKLLRPEAIASNTAGAQFNFMDSPAHPAVNPAQPKASIKDVLIGVSIPLCFPVGLILMWTQTNWQRRTKWIITGIFGLLLISALSQSKNSENTFHNRGADKETSTSVDTVKLSTQTEYVLGQEFTLGEYKYNVVQVEKTKKIGTEMFGTFTGTVSSPGAIFVVVTYTIENCTKSTKTVDAEDFILIDSEGRRFHPSSDANTALLLHEDDKDFLLSELHPGIARRMKQAFEIPMKAMESELILTIPKKGLFSSGHAAIRLKL